MAFRVRPGEALSKVIRAAIRLIGGLMILIWAGFGLWLSWKCATHILRYLARTIFLRPW